MSTDGAYDTKGCYAQIQQREAQATIPPRKNAKIQQHGNCKAPPLIRDENLRAIRQMGRKKWKRGSGDHRRSIAETTQKLRFSPPWDAAIAVVSSQRLDQDAFASVSHPSARAKPSSRLDDDLRRMPLRDGAQAPSGLAHSRRFRLKCIFGGTLSSRQFDNQAVELFLQCSALNRMIQLCKPESYIVAS